MMDLLRFFIAVVVSLLDPLLLAGYLAAGLLSPRLRWAALAGVAWAILLSLLFWRDEFGRPLPMYIFIARLVAAAAAASLIFGARRLWRRL